MLLDRASAYGDGLFETIAIRNGMPRFWDLHLMRLQSGCARLHLPCPSPEALQRELSRAIEATTVPTGFASARLVVTAAPSPRGYKRAANEACPVSVTVFETTPLPSAVYEDGVQVMLCSTRLGLQPRLAGIKTLNRLEQVLARAEWDDPQVFEGLTLDTAGRLICGTMSNVFVVSDAALITPALTRCGVSGIMRSHLVGLLRANGVDVEVRDIAEIELESVTEMFLTNSQVGVVPVRQLTSREWTVGPVTRRAQELAGENGVPECAS